MKKNTLCYLLIAILVVTSSITASAATKTVSETVDLSAKTDQIVSFSKLFSKHLAGPGDHTFHVTVLYNKKITESGLFGARETTFQRCRYRETNRPGRRPWYEGREREVNYYIYTEHKNDKVMTYFLAGDYLEESANVTPSNTLKVFVTDREDPMLYDATFDFFIPLAVYQEWLNDANGDLASLSN